MVVAPLRAYVAALVAMFTMPRDVRLAWAALGRRFGLRGSHWWGRQIGIIAACHGLNSKEDCHSMIVCAARVTDPRFGLSAAQVWRILRDHAALMQRLRERPCPLIGLDTR